MIHAKLTERGMEYTGTLKELAELMIEADQLGMDLNEIQIDSLENRTVIWEILRNNKIIPTDNQEVKK